jgi:hypothetical protein
MHIYCERTCFFILFMVRLRALLEAGSYGVGLLGNVRMVKESFLAKFVVSWHLHRDSKNNHEKTLLRSLG